MAKAPKSAGEDGHVIATTRTFLPTPISSSLLHRIRYTLRLAFMEYPNNRRGSRSEKVGFESFKADRSFLGVTLSAYLHVRYAVSSSCETNRSAHQLALLGIRRVGTLITLGEHLCG